MENTGERHIIEEKITEEADLYNHLLHLATYQYAEGFIAQKRVLDYGCGSGYGSFSMSKVAEHVVAVDVSKEAVEFAKGKYKAQNLEYNLTSDLRNEKFDVITSFQVIEHVSNDKEYVRKLKSLLKPNGYLLISTPDRKGRLYRFIQKPWNIFHLKEYSYKSLNKLLSSQFDEVRILKIGSKSELVLKEISRTKRQKLVTLPCTLFFYPNAVRVFLLKMQSKLFKKAKAFLRPKAEQNDDTKEDLSNRYTIADIEFDENLEFSTDLLAICK